MCHPQFHPVESKQQPSHRSGNRYRKESRTHVFPLVASLYERYGVTGLSFDRVQDQSRTHSKTPDAMTADITFHFPPELFSLLVDTVPLLNRSKKDVLTFFRGAESPSMHQ
jgi:hypothetical protein